MKVVWGIRRGTTWLGDDVLVIDRLSNRYDESFFNFDVLEVKPASVAIACDEMVTTLYKNSLGGNMSWDDVVAELLAHQAGRSM